MYRSGRARLFLITLAAAIAAVSGQAALVTYVASVGGEERSATLSIVESDGNSYVSLSSLMRQVRGVVRQSEDQIAVDFSGAVATTRSGEREVRSPAGAFFLSQPLRVSGNDVLISLRDVQPFFNSAFRAAIRQESALGAEPAEGAETPAPAPPATRPNGGIQVQELGEPALTQPELPPAETAAPQWEPAPPSPPAAQALPERPRELVIIIDPGHGGTDGGVAAEALAEKDLTLALAIRLQQALSNLGGAKVLLMRNNDTYIPPATRVTYANHNRGSLLISLHAGASASPVATGFDIFYSEGVPAGGGHPAVDTAEPLARALQESLGRATGATCRGMHGERCLIFRSLAMPAVLVEVGCLTTESDAQLLATEEYQQKLVEGMASAITAWVIEQNEPRL